ncbi:Chitin deacetylase 1 [Mucor velutinosus]|uniref:Chitin deacetylase 1 n=1 Tax=Mucor velutinosus TaxID=708070 RepID=A0AAN7DND3_9FUNG|nr:Chitin deacetylase 1 [Mucor velutinosus]
MSSSDKITFYNAVICPYAQRAAIALKEVGVEYETVNIDLQNKPDWYKDVNPELKVPALNVEGQNLAESLVIIEYLADRFPKANLLPKEPLKRANVRFAIEYFSSKISSEFYKYLFNQSAENARENFETNVNAALIRFNELLLQQSKTGPYFLGEEYSLADIAITPFVLRIFALLEHILGGYKFEAIKSNPRLDEFITGVIQRQSAQETWVGGEKFIEAMSTRFNLKK